MRRKSYEILQSLRRANRGRNSYLHSLRMRGKRKNKSKKNSSTLKTVAKIFMLLGCIASAFLWLVPLCWTIPMTVKYWRDVAYHRPTSVAFKVCSLFFVNVIAGILMLCDNDE